MQKNRVNLKLNNYIIEDENLKKRNYITQINESLILSVDQ